jgi:hypothetical protein
LTPVRVDASWAVTSTHGSYDTGLALADGVGEDAGVGEPVLAVVDEPHAAAAASNSAKDAMLIVRNMELVSLGLAVRRSTAS